MSSALPTMFPVEEAVTPEAIQELIARLSSRDGVERQKARQSLVGIGAEAVSCLLPLLDSQDSGERWEAAKTLLPIHDSAATEALIQTFHLDDENLRWVAAEALVGIGKPALEACLSCIIKHINAGFMRQGMHQVMHGFAATEWGEFLYPVWKALDGAAWHMSAPLAAEQALCHWQDRPCHG